MTNAMFTHRYKAGKGMITRLFGRFTGNSRMETEGRADQVSGDLGQAGGKVKKAFEH
ncbi:CsbD family protein [Nocardia sp. NPDC051570]|uniref:CsbD family protein n=1 Tax=Nocardia sp. NPDC051570 TaxID=3364324 RepID=UPI00378C4285